ncbi:hypothetical protein F5984_13145 [Rudanella paleaurantiibacter]|uniref:Uncharacterized protein n=1 Tax=Rudanella paleaurantiibacter TaxID=2614655 RepID=A0A7J5TYC1_9BACT|nr:hypothetical protein [Rudanella paleaurantiibacter]KAB7730123.1 hypothetical protein F5984_13145 [Rudanella paleaurantiibacter]
MILRYLLYTDPSREQTIQIGEDIPNQDQPHTPYGGEIVVEGQTYIIANIPYVKMIPHPVYPDSHAGILQIFLARPEQWSDFPMSEAVKLIHENNLKKRQN